MSTTRAQSASRASRGSEMEESYASPQYPHLVGSGPSSSDGRKRRSHGSSNDEEHAVKWDGFSDENLRVGGPYLCAIQSKLPDSQEAIPAKAVNSQSYSLPRKDGRGVSGWMEDYGIKSSWVRELNRYTKDPIADEKGVNCSCSCHPLVVNGRPVGVDVEGESRCRFWVINRRPAAKAHVMRSDFGRCQDISYSLIECGNVLNVLFTNGPHWVATRSPLPERRSR